MTEGMVSEYVDECASEYEEERVASEDIGELIV
jgi:hypothetical protein